MYVGSALATSHGFTPFGEIGVKFGKFAGLYASAVAEAPTVGGFAFQILEKNVGRLELLNWTVICGSPCRVQMKRRRHWSKSENPQPDYSAELH